jgi:hypothetical protein
MNKTSFLLSFGIMYFGVVLNGNIVVAGDEVQPGGAARAPTDPANEPKASTAKSSALDWHAFLQKKKKESDDLEKCLQQEPRPTSPADGSKPTERSVMGAIVGNFVLDIHKLNRILAYIRKYGLYATKHYHTHFLKLLYLPGAHMTIRRKDPNVIALCKPFLENLGRREPGIHVRAISEELNELQRATRTEPHLIKTKIPGVPSINLYAWAVGEVQRKATNIVSGYPNEQEYMLQVLTEVFDSLREGGNNPYKDKDNVSMLDYLIHLFFTTADTITATPAEVLNLLAREINLLQQRIFEDDSIPSMWPQGSPYYYVMNMLSQHLKHEQVQAVYMQQLTNFHEAIMNGNERKVVLFEYSSALYSLCNCPQLRILDDRHEIATQYIPSALLDPKICDMCKQCLKELRDSSHNEEISRIYTYTLEHLHSPTRAALCLEELEILQNESVNNPNLCTIYADALLYWLKYCECMQFVAPLIIRGKLVESRFAPVLQAWREAALAETNPAPKTGKAATSAAVLGSDAAGDSGLSADQGDGIGDHDDLSPATESSASLSPQSDAVADSSGVDTPRSAVPATTDCESRLVAATAIAEKKCANKIYRRMMGTCSLESRTLWRKAYIDELNALKNIAYTSYKTCQFLHSPYKGVSRREDDRSASDDDAYTQARRIRALDLLAKMHRNALRQSLESFE